MAYKMIRIDDEVFKEITANRNKDESENLFLRRLLKLPPIVVKNADGSYEKGKDLVYKNVVFKHGSVYRMLYKGKDYKITVVNGHFHCDGYDDQDSPSGMATQIARTSTNGWKSIEYYGPEEWTPIQSLRSTEKIARRSPNKAK